MQLKDRHMWMVFVLPGVVMLVLVLGWPAVTSILYSFETEQPNDTAYTLANYAQLLKDPFFSTTFWNTGIFVACSVSLHMVLGLAVAMILNTALPAKPLFRVIALLPWVVPDVVAGIVWKWMYDPIYGALNDLLLRFGLIENPIEWLSNPGLAMFSVILVNLWRGFPFVMLILLAGLQSIHSHHLSGIEKNDCCLLGARYCLGSSTLWPYSGHDPRWAGGIDRSSLHVHLQAVFPVLSF